MKKKWIVIVAAVVAILVGVLLVILLRPSSAKFDSGDESSAYPYSYEIGKKKLTVRIAGERPEGYEWLANVPEQDVLTVSEPKVRKDVTEFTVTPTASGAATVMFVLEREGDLPDRIYELTSSFLVDDELSIDVTGSDHRELSGLIIGQGADFTYRIAEQNGGLLVRVDKREGASWSVSDAGDSVSVWGGEFGKEPEEGAPAYIDFSIIGSRVGSAVIHLTSTLEIVDEHLDEMPTTLSDPETGEPFTGEHLEDELAAYAEQLKTYTYEEHGCIELEVTVDALYNVTLDAHRTLEPEETRIVTDTSFIDLYGSFSRGAEVYLGTGRESTVRFTSREDGVTAFDVGCVEYDFAGTWTLYISGLASEADFAGADERVAVASGENVSANVYAGDYGVRCVWADDNTRYSLECAETTVEDAMTVTEMLLDNLF